MLPGGAREVGGVASATHQMPAREPADSGRPPDRARSAGRQSAASFNLATRAPAASRRPAPAGAGAARRPSSEGRAAALADSSLAEGVHGEALTRGRELYFAATAEAPQSPSPSYVSASITQPTSERISGDASRATPGQRATDSVAGKSPEASPAAYASLLGRFEGSPTAQDDGLRRLQGNYGTYVGRVIQAKLAVGVAGDTYEQEADHLADSVMRMPDPAASEGAAVSGHSGVSHIQRMCMECERELRRHPADGGGGGNPSTSAGVEASVESARAGTGEPLPGGARAFFEPRFDQDFGHVRLYTDGAAAESARQLGALAYTLGPDIVFGAGQYAPETEAGKRLLAHELTHVVQQGEGRATLAAAPRSPVRGRTGGPLVQGAWTLTSTVTNSDPVVSNHARGHASTLPIPLPTGVVGSVRARQVAAFWEIEGGNAHLRMWRNTRYTFVHTGHDNNLLTLRGSATIGGGAEADYDHYAQAGAAVAGTIAVRTIANPAPTPTPLFPLLEDAGESTPAKTPVGDINVQVPVGSATVEISLPITKTDKGELAPLGGSQMVNRDEPGGCDWKMVDVYLVAQFEATADIDSEFFGLEGDVNWAGASAAYALFWEDRPIPGECPPPSSTTTGTGASGTETAPGTPGVAAAAERCTHVGTAAYRFGNRNARNLTPRPAQDVPSGLSVSTTPGGGWVFSGDGKATLRGLGFEIEDDPSARDPCHFLVRPGSSHRSRGWTLAAWAATRDTMDNANRATWHELTKILRDAAT